MNSGDQGLVKELPLSFNTLKNKRFKGLRFGGVFRQVVVSSVYCMCVYGSLLEHILHDVCHKTVTIVSMCMVEEIKTTDIMLTRVPFLFVSTLLFLCE